ncbi:cyclin-B1-2-like [Triticum dicoccoides]|uniref:cyclin-B1-2-like n=1 Tax=Triticum dicoccoides TaxID=85692 RepID=UPI00188EA7C2|nr:cyclin-B1-2-like [Triticum dicoccoides]
MASGGGLMMKKELGETHDVLRFSVNDSLRGDLAPAHPVQATIHKEAKFWDEKNKFGTEAIYGSAFNIRRDLDAQILSRYQLAHIKGHIALSAVPEMHANISSSSSGVHNCSQKQIKDSGPTKEREDSVKITLKDNGMRILFK